MYQKVAYERNTRFWERQHGLKLIWANFRKKTPPPCFWGFGNKGGGGGGLFTKMSKTPKIFRAFGADFDVFI